jgi:biotin carboxyl carrier protein
VTVVPTRLQISDGHTTWTTDVSGTHVSVRGADGPVEVTGSERDGYDVKAGAAAPVRGVAAVQGDTIWVSVDGTAFEFHVVRGRDGGRSARDQDALAPPMSATVVRIAVKPGDRVTQGDLLVALEAMKMELPIRAPRDGVVTAIHCAEGDLVQPGAPLVDMD